MSLFAPQSTVREKCSCGATFTASGYLASYDASQWRRRHVCPNRKSPGKDADA